MTTKKRKHIEEVAAREEDITAEILTRPEVQAAITIQQWQNLHEIDALSQTLSSQIDDVNNGKMQRPEAMLLAQAHTLDQLFNTLAQRAHRRETVTSCEIHLRLAFKAQNQCRSTLETLAAIKNPPVVFAKQANISSGHQQINNGTPAPASHVGKIKNPQYKLLEVNDGERLDTRTKTTASSIDSDMETVGKINRTKNSRRQGKSIPQRI